MRSPAITASPPTIRRRALGLPEIKVGLFPGAGGTQRIARMMATADALQFLLKGDQLRLDRAKTMKLVDNVVPAADLVRAAKDWIKAGRKAKQPWDVDGFKLPGGPVYSKAGMMTFPAANAIYRQETHDNYPAARAIMQCVYEGLQVPFDTALRIESRYFAKIVRSPEAAAMIRSLFVSMQELNKGARRPEGAPPSTLKKIGVLGAGFMGAGIAYVTAQAGIDVVLIDRDQEAADKGKAYSANLMAGQIKRGRAKQADARRAARAHHGDAGLRRARRACDLVIEAVFEDRKVKAEATAKAQAVVGDKVVFGSNTSTLPITSLAEQSKDPTNFIGIHFFSPVEKMMLVEIIMGKKTGDAALAVALDYVRAIRKTPIVVNDSRGFYTSRVVGTYIREGHLMLTEGVPAAMIENVGRMAGMPVGPLSLNDEVAVDLAWKILQSDRSRPRRRRDRPAAEGAARGDGREARPPRAQERQGLLRLSADRSEAAVAGPCRACSRRSSIPTRSTWQELKHRLLAIQALETARCFEEGVLTDVREADVGSILGFGFAPYSGGTLSYIDMMGTKKFVELCQSLEKKYGARFAPNKLLLDMAAKGETFYTRFAPKRQKAAA